MSGRALYRSYLDEVVTALLPRVEGAPAGIARLRIGLEAYWDACYARRATRRELMALAAAEGGDPELDRLGRPFLHMLHSELLQAGHPSAADAAASLYREAQTVSQEEARQDQVLPRLRQQALYSIVGQH